MVHRNRGLQGHQGRGQLRCCFARGVVAVGGVETCVGHTCGKRRITACSVSRPRPLPRAVQGVRQCLVHCGSHHYHGHVSLELMQKSGALLGSFHTWCLACSTSKPNELYGESLQPTTQDWHVHWCRSDNFPFSFKSVCGQPQRVQPLNAAASTVAQYSIRACGGSDYQGGCCACVAAADAERAACCGPQLMVAVGRLAVSHPSLKTNTALPRV
jgi:hypothetical protein